MITVVDYADPIDINEYEDDQSTDILAAEILRGKPYSCPALKPSRGKEVVKTESRESYIFDISKADHLLKDKQIKLPEGHRIPSAEEIKNRQYCKWHNSFSHSTNNSMVFRNAVQQALKEGRFKLADKGTSDLQTDVDPFPTVPANVITVSGSPPESSGGSGRKLSIRKEWRGKGTTSADQNARRSQDS